MSKANLRHRKFVALMAFAAAGLGDEQLLSGCDAGSLTRACGEPRSARVPFAMAQKTC
jgi:hypothetical protein